MHLPPKQGKMLIDPGFSLNEFTLWALPILDPHLQPVSSPFGFDGSARFWGRTSLVNGLTSSILCGFYDLPKSWPASTPSSV